MNHLHRRRDARYARIADAKRARCFDHQKRPQSFATIELRVAHRIRQVRGPHDFARERLVRQKRVEHGLHIRRDERETFGKG